MDRLAKKLHCLLSTAKTSSSVFPLTANRIGIDWPFPFVQGWSYRRFVSTDPASA
jgi:hypothetical protein